MRNAITASYELSTDKQARLRALTKAPQLAWPTLWLTLVGWLVILASDYLAVVDTLPLWAACLINGVAGYLMFSAAHDGIHRAISSHTGVNDWIGRIAIASLSPMASLGLFRWGHIQHHRFTVSDQDPDRWAYAGPGWLLPFKWMFIDVWYLYYAINAHDRVANRHLKYTAAATLVSVSIIVALCFMGYGVEVLLLWFIPSRIAAILLGFAFFWLPHEPHDVSQAENFTRASTVRLGWEWLLSPLLQFHNYHLIHHLHPMTPFYNNGRVWRLLEPSLRQHELAIQYDFAIKPKLYRPPAT